MRWHFCHGLLNLTHSPQSSLVKTLQGPRLSDSMPSSDHERKIEAGRVDQEPLHNVVSPSQVRPPHPARFVHASETLFRQLQPQLLQLFAAPAPHSPPVAIHPLLLRPPPLSLPLVLWNRPGQQTAPTYSVASRITTERGVAVYSLCRGIDERWGSAVSATSCQRGPLPRSGN